MKISITYSLIIKSAFVIWSVLIFSIGTKTHISELVNYFTPSANAQVPQHSDDSEIQILFVGNSLTYTNDLPKLVQLEAKERGVSINTKMVAFPNYSLQDHWENNTFQHFIKSSKYDYLIIQQGPSSQAESRESLLKYGKIYKEFCLKYKCKLAFFMVWPSRQYNNTFDGVIQNYSYAAKTNEVLLLPVGKVWKENFDQTENYDYYGNDGFHPSLKGSLIAAEIIANSIVSQTNENPKPALDGAFGRYSNVRDFTMPLTGDEVYFTILSPMEEISVIAFTEKEGDIWKESQLAIFSGKYRDLEPFILPDGLKLFFASNRPLDSSSEKTKDFDIWYVERETKDSPWSEPINLGAPINTDKDEFYPSLSKYNNLYFTSDRGVNSHDDIYVSKWVDNKFSMPILLNPNINTEGYEFNAYIAWDESYIIYTAYNREDGYGSGDLYISYSGSNGKWGKSENMGMAINSEKMDYCPFIDTSKNILYFTSKRSTIGNHNKNFKSLSQFIDELNKYENGLSRIYKVPFFKVN